MIGNEYKDLVCVECKAKVQRATKELSKLDMLRPHKTAKKFMRLMCPSCFRKIKNRMKKNQGGN